MLFQSIFVKNVKFLKAILTIKLKLSVNYFLIALLRRFYLCGVLCSPPMQNKQSIPLLVIIFKIFRCGRHFIKQLLD